MAPETAAVYRNEVVGGNWIKFAARGRVGNRDGFGARVVMETAGHVRRQWFRNGVGYRTTRPAPQPGWARHASRPRHGPLAVRSGASTARRASQPAGRPR